MAKSYMVGYDLNRPHQNYAELIQAIKDASNGSWWHHLDSTWIIRSELSAVQIRDRLTPHIDSNDEILVATLTGEAAWRGFNTPGSEWLKNNL